MFIDKCTQTTVGLQASAENNPLCKILSGNCKISIDILYTLFNLYNSCGNNIFVSQETIAKKSGCSLRSANGKLGELHASSIIVKIRSEINNYDTCRYQLTDLAFKEKSRILYWHRYFKGLAFAAGILVSSPQVEPRDCVLYSYKDNSYTKTADCSSENLFLKLYSIYCETKKRREYIPPHHYPTENREIESLTTKKESSMEQPKWVTPTLNSVTKTLNLSKWGQIRLSAYPDQALFHALNALKASKSPKNDLFKWFGFVCNEWCKKNNVSPNWSVMHKLATENEIPDNPTLILAAKALDIPKAKAKSESKASEQYIQELRQRNRDRIAQHLPEDVEKERAYLAANPGWLERGRQLMVEMSRWETPVEKAVTEIKDQIVCAQIDHDEVVWDNVTYVPIADDEEYEEIF